MFVLFLTSVAALAGSSTLEFVPEVSLMPCEQFESSEGRQCDSLRGGSVEFRFGAPKSGLIGAIQLGGFENRISDLEVLHDISGDDRERFPMSTLEGDLVLSVGWKQSFGVHSLMVTGGIVFMGRTLSPATVRMFDEIFVAADPVSSLAMGVSADIDGSFGVWRWLSVLVGFGAMSTNEVAYGWSEIAQDDDEMKDAIRRGGRDTDMDFTVSAGASVLVSNRITIFLEGGPRLQVERFRGPIRASADDDDEAPIQELEWFGRMALGLRINL